MAKIIVKTRLFENFEIVSSNSVNGIKNMNELVFKEEDINVSVSILDKEVIIKRTTDDYELNINFKESLTTFGIYDIKGVGKIDIKINTKELLITQNSIYLEYELEMGYINSYKYELSYEVI